jgi:hypothetical protein
VIAPLRLPDSEVMEDSRRLREARRTVADALLTARASASQSSKRTAPWKVWLFAAWVAAATGVYVASLAGWL